MKKVLTIFLLFTTLVQAQFVKFGETTPNKVLRANGTASSVGASSPKTYFINSSTGDNLTGVYEDSSHPFASIDYVNANYTIQDGDIFYLLGTGLTYPINNKLKAVHQTLKADEGSTNIIDFSSNTNQDIIEAGGDKMISIVLPNGKIRNERSGGTGVIFASYYTGVASFYIDVDEVYWNTSTLMGFNYGASKHYLKANKITSKGLLLQVIDNDIEINTYTCLAAGAELAQYCKNIKIHNVVGAGSYTFHFAPKYSVGDISTTGACTIYGTGVIDFIDSTITGGGLSISGGAGISVGDVTIRGSIKSVSTITTGYPGGGIISFKNFNGNFGNNSLAVCWGSTINFENSSIKSTNTLFGTGFNGAYGDSNIVLKSSAFEVTNAVPLCTKSTSPPGGTIAIKVSGVSTNATMISDQIGTGVTVTQFTNY